MEANPESVTEARLAAYRRAGVNRLSFGVQSFREDELRRLSRLHSADRARAAFAEARAAGFDNISLDLMMWLPEQRVSEWLESIDASIALGPEHLSLYMLEVYPNAPLKDDMARARWSQAPDDDVAAMYLEAMARLDAAGYAQYESRTWRSPGGDRGTTSNTGPTANGSGSAAARTPHGLASGGTMSRPRRSTSKRPPAAERSGSTFAA